MLIRRAEVKDTEGVLDLLHQVLNVHADLRPDLFIKGTTKYSAEELREIFEDDNRPVYVATDDEETVLGYAFCVLQEPNSAANTVQHRSLYLDDLCVDETTRGQHVGSALFEHVKSEAKRLGCYHLTLNVWTGNDTASRFYEAMGLKPLKTTMEMIL